MYVYYESIKRELNKRLIICETALLHPMLRMQRSQRQISWVASKELLYIENGLKLKRNTRRDVFEPAYHTYLKCVVMHPQTFISSTVQYSNLTEMRLLGQLVQRAARCALALTVLSFPARTCAFAWTCGSTPAGWREHRKYKFRNKNEL